LFLFFSCFACFFSLAVFSGFFLSCFFASWPFAITAPGKLTENPPCVRYIALETDRRFFSVPSGYDADAAVATRWLKRALTVSSTTIDLMRSAKTVAVTSVPLKQAVVMS
jgi:hypothetical protein